MFKSIKINDFRILKNIELKLGGYITMLAGWNQTGKSTILALLANSTELKKEKTYTGKKFQADFSEILKGSINFDCTKSDRLEISCSDKGKERKKVFRTAWQESNTRFRVIPKETKKSTGIKDTEAKFEFPVIYLGLSRLFPIGETEDTLLKEQTQLFSSKDDEKWFKENCIEILSAFDDQIDSITDIEFQTMRNKGTSGINTNSYDWKSNSAGQGNISQILFAVLSFMKQKKEHPGGLLLIDEIEASLHPLAQRKLIDVLIKAAKDNKFQIVFTTHSLTLMEYFADKKHDEDNNIEYYYFTKRNHKLIKQEHPSYEDMRKDILRELYVERETVKVDVYTEDDEGKWFLKHCMDSKILKKINVISLKLSCNNIIELLKGKLSFKFEMFVLDGDVKDEQFSKIKKTKKNNCFRLPTSHDKNNNSKFSPEKNLFIFLSSQTKVANDYFAEAAKFNENINYEYFMEHSPDKEKGEKERDKYKNWFKKHKKIFEKTKIMKYWIKENEEQVSKFSREFEKRLNKILESLGVKK